MQSEFIKTCTALSVVGLAGAAYAGDTPRFDVSFSGFDVLYADISTNASDVDTAGLGGRYFGSHGNSNLDFDVYYNVGGASPNFPEEIRFVMEMDDGTTGGAGGLYFLGNPPFAGDQDSAANEGEFINKTRAEEVDNPFPAFTYQVPADGLVTTGVAADYNDGTGLRHSVCNTADFYFTLAADAPAGCVGATGSCGEANGTPGCEDLSCCSNVCDTSQGGDPFCCDSSWDSSCVDLAVTLCDIFQYSCDAPNQANDCATSPIMMTNGETVSFDTTGANTDGPNQAECQSGEDLPVWSDLWYMVEVDVDANMTATTCLTADFDTKVAIYDAGAIGSTFDVATLPNVLVICNEDCPDDPTIFTSEAVGAVVAGNQYLIRVGGYQQAVGSGTLSVSWVEPDPPIPAQECSAGNPDSFSQIDPAAGDFVDANIVSCNGPTYSADNSFCRVYSAADMGGDVFSVDCVKIPCLVTVEYVPGVIRLLKSASGQPAPYADLELIAENNVGLYQNPIDDTTDPDNPVFVPAFQIANFGGAEVDLSDGSSLVVEIEFIGNDAGYTIPSGGTLANVVDGVSTTYLRSAACGITEYTSVGGIGFDSEMFQFVEGSLGGGGTPCPTDFNGDGVTDGADFGSILAKWGPCPGCPEDLTGDGEVSGADVGQILAAWGVCAP